MKLTLIRINYLKPKVKFKNKQKQKQTKKQ